VGLMGGKIRVESEVGRGSTFHFTARLDVANAPVFESAAANLLVPRRRKTDRIAASSNSRSKPDRPLNILLAEDNAINQRVTQHMLRIAGHQVTVAQTGKLALASLEQNAFDVVLMDLQMPEMDGFQATAAIREQERLSGRHLPVIAMTAHALKGDRERCLAAGMDDYISKPVTSGSLLAALAATQLLPCPEEVFDLAAALQLVEGDLEFLCHLAAMLDEDAPQQIADIRDAVESQDAAQLERSAHRLKGSLVPFAAPAAMKAAQALEVMGHSGELSNARGEYRLLDAEILRLLATLKGLTYPASSLPAGPVFKDGSNHSGSLPCTA